MHVDLSGNLLTGLNGLESLTSLRWLDASHNALKASTLPAVDGRGVTRCHVTCLQREATASSWMSPLSEEIEVSTDCGLRRTSIHLRVLKCYFSLQFPLQQAAT